MVDGLQGQGYSVHLVNTTVVYQYEGIKHRGDESDAKHMAHLLRLGLLPEGYCRAEPGFRLLKSTTGIGDALATVILLPVLKKLMS